MILCIAAPQLLSPLGGLLVDRVRRRSLLLVVNPLTALAVLPLLPVHEPRDLWILYVVARSTARSYTLLGAGQSALLATMVPADLLAPANAALQTVREALRLVTPVAGAGLYTVAGGGAVAILDAATFLAATPRCRPARARAQARAAHRAVGSRRRRRAAHQDTPPLADGPRLRGLPARDRLLRDRCSSSSRTRSASRTRSSAC